MTRFVLDCDAVVELARGEIDVAFEHELLEGVVATATIDALRAG